MKSVLKPLAAASALAVSAAATAAVDPAFNTAVTGLAAGLIEYMSAGVVGFIGIMALAFGFRFVIGLTRRVGK
jgi:hypothetical protein